MGLIVATAVVALLAENAESAELGDHATAGDAVGGGAIGACAGIHDLRDSVAQFTKRSSRVFFVGTGAVRAVQGIRAAADVIDLAAYGCCVSFCIDERLVRGGAERLMYFVAEGRTDEADEVQGGEVDLVLGEVVRDEFSVVRDQGDAVSLKQEWDIAPWKFADLTKEMVEKMQEMPDRETLIGMNNFEA